MPPTHSKPPEPKITVAGDRETAQVFVDGHPIPLEYSDLADTYVAYAHAPYRAFGSLQELADYLSIQFRYYPSTED
jgi:hypothetical protein